MTKYTIKTIQSRIDRGERAKRLAQVYRRILEWNVPERIEIDPLMRGGNDLDLLINNNAKPTDGAADLADEKANPQDDDGELTYD